VLLVQISFRKTQVPSRHQSYVNSLQSYLQALMTSLSTSPLYGLSILSSCHVRLDKDLGPPSKQGMTVQGLFIGSLTVFGVHIQFTL